MPPRPAVVMWDFNNMPVPAHLDIAVVVQQMKRRFYEVFEIAFFMMFYDLDAVGTRIGKILNSLEKVSLVNAPSKAIKGDDNLGMLHTIETLASFTPGLTIILVSSDVDFAPMLAHVRDQYAAYVILLHVQTSQALRNSADESMEFFETLAEWDLRDKKLFISGEVQVKVTCIPAGVENLLGVLNMELIRLSIKAVELTSRLENERLTVFVYLKSYRDAKKFVDSDINVMGSRVNCEISSIFPDLTEFSSLQNAAFVPKEELKRILEIRSNCTANK